MRRLGQPPTGALPVRWRVLWLALSLAAAAAPFLSVRYAPITDLPQQAAQVRLFLEALGDPASPYAIQWGSPNTLALGVLGLAWGATSPLAAGRVAMLLLALAWVAGVHALAWHRGRSPAAAALASVLVFNGCLYWGFYSFMLGFPVFAGWLLLTHGDVDVGVRRAWRRAPWFLAGALLLYLAHALWLAAGLAWLALETLLSRRSRSPRVHLVRWLAVLPVVACAAWWFAGIGESDFATPPLWGEMPWLRPLPEKLAEMAFGGIRGRFEPLLLALLMVCPALGLITRRGVAGGDGRLAAAGGMFLAMALVFPDKYTNTILFDDRWMPVALALLLLAAPPPRLAGGWTRVVPAVLAALALAAQVAVTTAVWRRVEAEELSGIDAALAALPPSPRVLGLNLGPPSRYLRSAPFSHVFAYAQVVRGGELNFSFAQFASSPVIYRERRQIAWTPNLELLGHWVKRTDFRHFDFALISGTTELHERIAADPLLEPVTADGRWWLYRVTESARVPLSPEAFEPERIGAGESEGGGVPDAGGSG